MASLLVSFLIGLSSVQSETFIGSGILDGAADVEIDIGASETTVTMTLNDGLLSVAGGYGLGFGGLSMDGTYAVLIDIASSGTFTLDTREVTTRGPSNRGFDEISGADNWSIQVDTVNAALIITRDNDVSGSCSECYTFSPTQTELQIIYAESTSSLGASSKFTNHGGGGGIKGSMTLNAATSQPTTAVPTTGAPSTTAGPTTAQPSLPPGETAGPTTSMPTTAMPTTAMPTEVTMGPTTSMPTTSMPTEADDDDGYETCVEATELVNGVSIEIGRKTSDKTLQITITGEANKYSGFGFGAEKMDGTYAIIVTGEGTTDVMERTLGNQQKGDEITGDDKSFTAAESNTIDGSTQTVVIRRPYASDGTYDFTDLLTCELDSIDAISSQGESYTFKYHETRKIGSLDRTCDCESTPLDPPDGANNIFNVFYIGLVLIFSFYFVF